MTLRAEKDRGGRRWAAEGGGSSHTQQGPDMSPPDWDGASKSKSPSSTDTCRGKGHEARALCKRQELTWTIRPTPVPSVPLHTQFGSVCPNHLKYAFQGSVIFRKG